MADLRIVEHPILPVPLQQAIEFLWQGRTLWGMMLRDEQCLLDYLATRPEVDMTRVGATGMSMGCTRAWWLAAIDDRIRVVVGVAENAATISSAVAPVLKISIQSSLEPSSSFEVRWLSARNSEMWTPGDAVADSSV